MIIFNSREEYIEYAKERVKAKTKYLLRAYPRKYDLETIYKKSLILVKHELDDGIKTGAIALSIENEGLTRKRKK